MTKSRNHPILYYRVEQSEADFNCFRIVNEDREDGDLDTKYEAGINAALDIVQRIAMMTTPEEDFFADKGYKPGDVPPVHLQPSGFLKDQQSAEADIDDFIAEMSHERLVGEYRTLVELIRLARKATA